MFQISILCIFLSPFCNYEIVHLKGSDHVCFDTWWLSLLLRMHEHAPWYFFFYFSGPILFLHAHSCQELTSPQDSAVVSLLLGKPLSPFSDMYPLSSRVLSWTLLQSFLVALVTCTQHILHVHPFQSCWFPKHRDHGMIYTASWDVFWLSGFKYQLHHLLPMHVRKVFKFHFPICSIETDVISTSQDR